MDFIGFDLGKVSSTDREHIYELLGNRPLARILIESGT